MFHTTFDAEKKQWSGLKVDTIFNPKTSLGSVLLNVMQVNGSRVALICANTNKVTTFQELREMTIGAALSLRKFGCQKGHVLAFITERTGDFVPLMCTALCLGCKIAGQPLNSTQSERDYFLNLVKPDFVFCDVKEYDVLKERLKNAKKDVKIFTFDGQAGDSIPVDSLFMNAVADPYFVPAEINGETDIAFIVTTSGTTSKPKGALLTHAMVLDKVCRFSEFIGAEDILLAFNPLGGVSGIRIYITPILNGATIIANQGSYSPDRFFKLIEKFKVTYALVPALQTSQLIKHPQFKSADLSSLRLCTSGGLKISPHVIQRMNQQLTNGKLCPIFGLTESAGAIALNLHRPINNSVGQLISGCEAKIINEHGDRLGINEIGELCFKSTYMFQGYLTDEENVTSPFDDEGFFSTGDIAHFDDNGDLFIVDRKKLVFKSDGGLVIPNEIEGFLNQIDGVSLSCLVPVLNSIGDHLPAAVIVKSENSKCTAESIYNAVLDSFTPHNRLRGGVYFVQKLPLRFSSKIDRPSVARMAMEFYNNNK